MRWIARILVAFVVLIALVAAGGALYLRSQVKSQTAARRDALETGYAKHRAAILADHEWAATLGVLKPGSGGDAGAFLNPRLTWPGELEIVKKWRASLPADQPKLALDKSVTDAMGKDWLATDPAVLDKLDFAWLAQLSSFGFWDLETASPWSGNTFALVNAPLPDFSELMRWCKLRLARGIKDGQAAQAGAEVRQVARLALSTEVLLGAMVGVALLKAEDEARAKAASLGQPVEGWSTLDKASADRLRRVIYATTIFAAIEAPQGAEKDFERLTVGRCPALGEAVFHASVVRPLLRETHAADFERIGKLLETATECRLVRPRKVWAAPDDPANTLLADRGFCKLSETPSVACELTWRMASLLGLRPLAGEVVLGVAAPDWFKHYQEPAKP